MTQTYINLRMPFGKHRQKTFEDIYKTDPGYLRWMVREDVSYGGIFYGQCAKEFLRNQEQTSEHEQTTIVYKCSECGMRSHAQDSFSECAYCADQLCPACLKLHREMHQKARAQKTESTGDFQYAHRREYGAHADAFEDIFKRMFGDQQSSSKDHGNGTYTHTFTNHGLFVSSVTLAAFKVLGLAPTATVQEIKHAFRQKAKIAHPDTGGNAETFKKLNEAYQLALKHAERRN